MFAPSVVGYIVVQAEVFRGRNHGEIIRHKIRGHSRDDVP